MFLAQLRLDPHALVGPVRQRLFGGVLEQVGRGVYGGIFEPGHPHADANGFRRDVLEQLRQLGVTMARYPGGNFVSGYRWEDGVGPVEERPTRLDLAWHSLEPNTFGLNEFMSWCRLGGIEPMMAVNLGTRGVQEAVDLIEYCNVDGGTRLSDLRRAHGEASPHGIRLWCLGNEMDGDWQVGQKSPHDYGVLARTAARAMRRVDPGIELVACGSSGSDMPSFGEWERVVLHETYDEVDYISAHAYYFEQDGDLDSFLGSGVNMDRYIEDVIHTADHVRAVKKASKRINISFDEWNVWYQDQQPSYTGQWHSGEPRLEDHYNIADAVVVGSMLISLLRHSDRVTTAALAQLVNVIAPIMTAPDGRVWRQTIFHPFALTAQRASGVVLHGLIDVPSHDTAKHGEVPLVDAVATWDEDAGHLDVFAVNRSVSDDAVLRIDLRGFGDFTRAEATRLCDQAPYRRASAASPVDPQSADDWQLEDGILEIRLPAVSWTTARALRR